MPQAVKPTAEGDGRQDDQAAAFISYAREDHVFARRLEQSLRQRGVEVRGDWQLVKGADYEKQLHDFILTSDAVIFLLTPESAASGPCLHEVNVAAGMGKRLLPVVRRKCSDEEEKALPRELRLPQWTFMVEGVENDEGGFAARVGELVEAVNADFDLLPEHRRLLGAVETWMENGRRDSYLLRKDSLKRAEEWLARASARPPHKLPRPTPLQSEYIVASQRARRRGSRVAFSTVSVVALALALLSILALIQRGVAQVQRDLARENERKATENERRATENAEEAKRQQDIAETNQREAERQQGIAEQNAAEARRQQGLAEENAAEARRQQAVAEERSRVALSRQLAAQSLMNLDERPDLALQLGARAAEARPTDEARNALLTTLQAIPAARAVFKAGSVVRGAALSPDGRWLAATEENPDAGRPSHLLTLRDVNTGRSFILPGSQAPDSKLELWEGVSFSPDGRTLAACDWDGDIRLWALEPRGEEMGARVVGDLAHTLPRDGRGKAASIDMKFVNGRLISVHDNGPVVVWDLATRKPVNQFMLETELYGVAAISADCDVVAHPERADEGEEVFYRVVPRSAATGRPVGPVGEPCEECLGSRMADADAVALSGDGRTIAIAHGDKVIRLYDVLSGRPKGQPFRTHKDVRRLAFSRSGHKLGAADTDGTVLLWDLREAMEDPSVLGRQQTEFEAFSFSPDDSTLVSGSRNGLLVLWDAGGIPSFATDLGRNALVVAFSPATDMLAAAANGPGVVSLWEDPRVPSSKTTVQTGDRHITRLAFSPGGRTLAAGDSEGNTVLLNLAVRPAKVTPLPRLNKGRVSDLAFSADGRRLYGLHLGGKGVAVWDLGGAAPKGAWVGMVEASPKASATNGQLVAFDDGPDAVGVWSLRDASDGATPRVRRIPTRPGAKTDRLALSAGGTLLAVAYVDSVLAVCRLADGHCDQLRAGAGEPVYDNSLLDLAFSPDGQTLAVAYDQKFEIVLWDVRSGLRVGRPFKGIGSGGALAFSRRGDMLVWADVVHKTLLWETSIERWREQARRIADRAQATTERRPPPGPRPRRRAR
ncbi:MAG TPA: TIR domain-containing protein [Pyrinomonadaceae bacterium]